MTIDYSRFDAIRIDTSSSESSSTKSSSKASPLGKRISDEEAKVLRTTFDAKRVPCTTHRRTNNLLLLLTDRAESVNALAGYTKAFNLPQTETWVVPLLPRVLLNEEILRNLLVLLKTSTLNVVFFNKFDNFLFSFWFVYYFHVAV